MDTKTAQAVRRYIGERISHARRVDGHDQSELAESLTGRTDTEWSREMVASIETGRKRVDVADLCAIAAVQGRQVSWYFADAPSSLAGAIPGRLSPPAKSPGYLSPHAATPEPVLS